jgi:hypothetical protein
MRAHHTPRIAGPALAAALALAGTALSGCADEDDNALAPNSPVELPDIRGPEDLDDPYSGLLDAAFVEDLQAWVDHEVTLLAAVAEVVSPRVFTVTSTAAGDEAGSVLVVTTSTAVVGAEPTPGEDLLIAATPVDDFDAEVAAQELALDVDQGTLEEWDGEVVLVATILEATS